MSKLKIFSYVVLIAFTVLFFVFDPVHSLELYAEIALMMTIAYLVGKTEWYKRWRNKRNAVETKYFT